MFKRVVCVLFCFLLCGQVFAAPQSGLSVEIEAFMEEQGLNQSNFSMSYYNIQSGDSYTYCADRFVPVGRLRNLPLHMYFYEEESKGSFEPELPDQEEFMIDNMTLSDCRYHSIILGEDGVTQKMQAYIGTSMQYMELINERYGAVAAETLPAEYWNGQVLSVEFLMNCIRKISLQPELFGDLMANYSMIQKVEAFADGTVKYPVLQIRGTDGDYVTAIAEVSAPQNFLLVASVKDSERGDELLGMLNQVVCSYVDKLEGVQETEATEPTTQRNNSSYYIGEERMAKDGTVGRWLLITFGVAGVFALIGMIAWLIWRSRHRHY